jgi:hypothetical protein
MMRCTQMRSISQCRFLDTLAVIFAFSSSP